MYKQGDKVRIIANNSCHGFKIGQVVQLLQITDDDFIAYKGKNFWYLGEDEFVLDSFLPPVYFPTKMRIWEKILLYFVKRKISEEIQIGINVVMIYKELFNKVYIIEHFIAPPMHWNCRCKLN